MSEAVVQGEEGPGPGSKGANDDAEVAALARKLVHMQRQGLGLHKNAP